jgi:hypothetical protein
MSQSELPKAWTEATPDPEERCRHLRTKMMFVTTDWEVRAADYPSTTASYWCLKTMSAAGPDGGLAALGECRAGRGCFEPEE